MGRFRSSATEDSSEPGIDMSPLIDCVFILLIFFIVTTVFVEETGVEVDKPQAASATSLEKNSILIAITEKGEVVYGGQEIGLAGVQSKVRPLLQNDPKMPVIVQVDAKADAGLLVGVVDEAKLAGAEKVNVAASPRK